MNPWKTRNASGCRIPEIQEIGTDRVAYTSFVLCQRLEIRVPRPR